VKCVHAHNATQKAQGCIRFTCRECIHSADLLHVLSAAIVNSGACYGASSAKGILSTSALCTLDSLTTALGFSMVTNLQNVMAWGHLIPLFTGEISSGHYIPWRFGEEHCRE